MDRLQTMEIFVRVAEAGSFSRAAEQIHLPRSTVSAAVQALEARLRTRLINRTTRKMQLTADGLAYLEWCRGLLADIQDTEQRLRLQESRPRGLLRVDVPGRIAQQIIAPALPQFLARYPQIEIELGAKDRAVDLISEGVDCAIRVGAVRDDSLVARPLALLRQGSFASPAYLARHGVPQRPEDLPQHHVVHYLGGGSPGFDYRQDDQDHSLPMRARVSVDCAQTYIACCQAGLGLIQIPAYDAREHVRRGELVEVLPDFAPAPLPICALYPQRRYNARRVVAFIDWVQELTAALAD